MYKYIHTCIYIHISCLHTYTHTHIYTHAYKMYIERTQSTSETTARQRLRGQPPFSLSASRQRAVQTTSAYLHWCGADPPSSLSTPAPSLAMTPRNEVIFLPFWRGFLVCGVPEMLPLTSRPCPQLITWLQFLSPPLPIFLSSHHHQLDHQPYESVHAPK